MKQYILKNKYQTITILEKGAAIHQWIAFRDQTNIVLSHVDLKDYADNNKGYFNVLIGRCAGRIRDGRFSLDGNDYQLTRNFEGSHHGHGGLLGFHTKTFDLVAHSNTTLVLRCVSSDGDEGYPGNLSLSVMFILKGKTLDVRYEAFSDKDTIVNLTQHIYFNLSNQPTICNHHLRVNSREYLEVNECLIPTGVRIPVKNTLLDFTKRRILSGSVCDHELRNSPSGGLDHSLVCKKPLKLELSFERKKLLIKSDYKAVQLFSANWPLDVNLCNRSFVLNAGLAVEPQYLPDSINHEGFDKVTLKANERFSKKITYTLSE